MTTSDQSHKPGWRRVGFANVVALSALFVALGGGAYAASTIGTSDIKNKAVTSAKLDKKAVKGSNLAKDAVRKNKIKDDAVTTDKLGSESVTSSKLEHPSYWAVVSQNALIRSHGATSVTRFTAGNYRVVFETDVSQCSYQVTGSQTGQNLIGHADSDSLNNLRVFVSLRNPVGTRTDGNYNLAVHC